MEPRRSAGCYADNSKMSEASPSIDEVWTRLKAHEGQEFKTTSGLAFTYAIAGDIFRPSRTAFHVPKSEFAKALALVPCDGPGVINRIVLGPSYVWAVLHDTPEYRKGSGDALTLSCSPVRHNNALKLTRSAMAFAAADLAA